MEPRLGFKRVIYLSIGAVVGILVTDRIIHYLRTRTVARR